MMRSHLVDVLLGQCMVALFLLGESANQSWNLAINWQEQNQCPLGLFDSTFFLETQCPKVFPKNSFCFCTKEADLLCVLAIYSFIVKYSEKNCENNCKIETKPKQWLEPFLFFVGGELSFCFHKSNHWSPSTLSLAPQWRNASPTKNSIL